MRCDGVQDDELLAVVDTPALLSLQIFNSPPSKPFVKVSPPFAAVQ